jgi:hypothetical protein
MTTLLALDPGAKTGWALYQVFGAIWHLTGCGVVTPEDTVPDNKPQIVVIENPEIYPNSQARPKDILTLARIVGRYQERYREAKHIELVAPHKWKGSIPKDIMLARIEAAIPARDGGAVAAYKGGYRHNMIDAIGLGTWALMQPFTVTRIGK